MKMTMKTPGKEITIELPAWLERRIYSLFMTASKPTTSTKKEK